MSKAPKKSKRTKSKPVGDRKPKMGRPADPSARQKRYQLKHHTEELALWKIAAATCGMKLGEWIASALNGEAKIAHHVPTLARGKK